MPAHQTYTLVHKISVFKQLNGPVLWDYILGVRGRRLSWTPYAEASK